MIPQQLVNLDDSLDTLLLAFASRYVQWSPIVVILDICLGPVCDKQFTNVHTLLGILRKHIHYQMQRRVSIAVGLIDISAFQQQLFNDPNLKFDDC